MCAKMVLIVRLETIQDTSVPLISTEGAIRRPMTYDNHPIPSHPIPSHPIQPTDSIEDDLS